MTLWDLLCNRRKCDWYVDVCVQYVNPFNILNVILGMVGCLWQQAEATTERGWRLLWMLSNCWWENVACPASDVLTVVTFFLTRFKHESKLKVEKCRWEYYEYYGVETTSVIHITLLLDCFILSTQMVLSLSLSFSLQYHVQTSRVSSRCQANVMQISEWLGGFKGYAHSQCVNKTDA